MSLRQLKIPTIARWFKNPCRMLSPATRSESYRVPCSLLLQRLLEERHAEERVDQGVVDLLGDQRLLVAHERAHVVLGQHLRFAEGELIEQPAPQPDKKPPVSDLELLLGDDRRQPL